MELKITDVARLLQVTPKTIYRWVNAERIPYYRVNKQYRFDHREIENWAAAQGTCSHRFDDVTPFAETLSDLISRGGIHYKLEGSTMIDAITHAGELFPDMGGIKRNKLLLDALIRRENMSCTGLGYGIALPHPRQPTISDPRHEFISICMTERPIVADTVDGKAVHTLLFVICHNEVRHVRIMAKLSHLCRCKAFVDLLRLRALRSELSSFVSDRPI